MNLEDIFKIYTDHFILQFQYNLSNLLGITFFYYLFADQNFEKVRLWIKYSLSKACLLMSFLPHTLQWKLLLQTRSTLRSTA
jgi:hypothetical protein